MKNANGYILPATIPKALTKKGRAGHSAVTGREGQLYIPLLDWLARSVRPMLVSRERERGHRDEIAKLTTLAVWPYVSQSPFQGLQGNRDGGVHRVQSAQA